MILISEQIKMMMMMTMMMSGAVLNSRFLTRLLTSGEEDIKGVSILKEDILSTL